MVGEVALCTFFPSLFALVVHKEASVADVWDSSRDVVGGRGRGGGLLTSSKCLIIVN